MPAQGCSDIWFTCQPKEADGHVTKGCHDLGRCPAAYLTTVLVKGHIPHPVEAVLDAPVPPPKGEKSLGACFCFGEAGNRVGNLVAHLPFVAYRPFQAASLAKEGPVAVAHQQIGGP